MIKPAEEDTRMGQRTPEAPLATAEEARELWEEYRRLEAAVLVEEDYLWFAEWMEWEEGKRRVKRAGFGSRQEAESEARRRDGSVSRRKIKSACRKMAKLFGLEIPQVGLGQMELREEGGFLVVTERGEFYTHVQWLDGDLRTVKASTTVFVRSPQGRTWMGKGGAHRDQGFSDDDGVSATSVTLAINRAVLDAIGWGDESAEEMASHETIPDEEPGRTGPDTHGNTGEGEKAWGEIQDLLRRLPEDTVVKVVQWLRRECGVEVRQADVRSARIPRDVPPGVVVKLAEALREYADRPV